MISVYVKGFLEGGGSGVAEFSIVIAVFSSSLDFRLYPGL